MWKVKEEESINVLMNHKDVDTGYWISYDTAVTAVPAGDEVVTNAWGGIGGEAPRRERVQLGYIGREGRGEGDKSRGGGIKEDSESSHLEA